MPKEFVKLISKEGFEFIVDYRAACISNTIKNMLSFDGVSSQPDTCQTSNDAMRNTLCV